MSKDPLTFRPNSHPPTWKIPFNYYEFNSLYALWEIRLEETCIISIVILPYRLTLYKTSSTQKRQPWILGKKWQRYWSIFHDSLLRQPVYSQAISRILIEQLLTQTLYQLIRFFGAREANWCNGIRTKVAEYIISRKCLFNRSNFEYFAHTFAITESF